jgi:microcystin-dependent protein
VTPDERIDELERKVESLERRGLGLFQATPEDPNVFVLPKSIGAELLKDNTVGFAQLDSTTETYLVQTGGIVAYGGTAAPTGWFMCNGGVLVRATWPALFAVIGTAFNIGGEAGTDFRLPDLRGRVPAGVDSTIGAGGRLPDNDDLGNVGGSASITLATADIPAHTHGPGSLSTDNSGNHQHGLNNMSDAQGGGGLARSNSAGSDILTSAAGNHNHSVTGGVTASTGGGGSHENRQPYQVVNYIIKS